MAKFVEGYVKSMLFAGLYLAIVRRSICFLTGLQGYQGCNECDLIQGTPCPQGS